jgi:hypothetical protein
VIVETPRGTPWPIEDPARAARKLVLRGQLPGARVYDLAADALRRAKAAGATEVDRFTLALPASWLVNSPAISRVLRRWALPPARDAWLDLVRALDGSPERWTEHGDRQAVFEIVRRLRDEGDEPTAIEAISKVLALLVPDVAPLMPPAARAFVLGDAAPADAVTFCAMLDWFADAAARWSDALAAIARAADATELSPAQVLDRLLWFDSEGHRHFPAI